MPPLSVCSYQLSITSATFDVAAYTARCDLVKDEVHALKVAYENCLNLHGARLRTYPLQARKPLLTKSLQIRYFVVVYITHTSPQLLFSSCCFQLCWLIQARQRTGIETQLAAEEASLARLAAKKAESPAIGDPAMEGEGP